MERIGRSDFKGLKFNMAKTMHKTGLDSVDQKQSCARTNYIVLSRGVNANVRED